MRSSRPGGLNHRARVVADGLYPPPEAALAKSFPLQATSLLLNAGLSTVALGGTPCSGEKGARIVQWTIRPFEHLPPEGALSMSFPIHAAFLLLSARTDQLHQNALQVGRCPSCLAKPVQAVGRGATPKCTHVRALKRIHLNRHARRHAVQQPTSPRRLLWRRPSQTSRHHRF